MLKFLLAALLTLLMVSPAAAQLPEDLKSKVDAAVNQILSSTKVPSASIAIVKDGRIAYLKAYGLARLSPPMEAADRPFAKRMSRIVGVEGHTLA